jgi:hypothetical protein
VRRSGGKNGSRKSKVGIILILRIVPRKTIRRRLKEHKIDKLKVVFFIRNSRGSQFKMTDGSNYKSLYGTNSCHTWIILFVRC